MAAVSKHKSDIYFWVEKTIHSCKTLDQLRSAENLLEIYLKKYPTTFLMSFEIKLLLSKKISMFGVSSRLS